MIEELLLALSGFPGDLFYPASPDGSPTKEDKEKLQWRVAPELADILHPAEEEIVSKLLSLSAYVIEIENFVNAYGSLALFRNTVAAVEKVGANSRNSLTVESVGAENVPHCGTYAASLSEGFISILGKYRSHLVALERTLCDSKNEEHFQRPSCALSLIYAELQPFFRILPILGRLQKDVAVNIAKRGTTEELLQLLCCTYESERSDDTVEFELQALLRYCLTPFRNYLMLWLSTGRLETDKYGEFFIRDAWKDESQKEKEPILVKEALPPFIGNSVGEKLLFIGKSVKMMLESSLKYALDAWEDQLAPLHSLLLAYSTTGSGGSGTFQYDNLKFEIEKRVEVIRRAAGQKLYAFVFEETVAKNALEAWVKNAFFLGKGELFLAFIDLGEATFSAPAASDQLDKLPLLLSKYWKQAMEKIYWQNDKEQDYFSNVTPYFAAEVADTTKACWYAIHLRVEVPQRLRPIFTPKFITDLNQIFQFLLRWRRTQTLAEACWLALKKSPTSVTNSLPGLEKIQQMISLMVFVVKNFQYYIQADVLETFYFRMMKEATTCGDFERVLRAIHVDLVNNVRFHLFLKRDGLEFDRRQQQVGKLLKSFGDECDSFSILVLGRLGAKGEPSSGNGASLESAQCSIVENDRAFAARVHESYVNLQRRTALLFKILTISKAHESNAFLNRLLLRLDFNNYFSSTQMFSM